MTRRAFLMAVLTGGLQGPLRRGAQCLRHIGLNPPGRPFQAIIPRRTLYARVTFTQAELEATRYARPGELWGCQ